MRKSILTLALLAVCGMANAQIYNGNLNAAESDATANSGSASQAEAASNSGGNEIKPNQQVGVSFTQTYEASTIPTRTTQRFKTNNSVPLAAAVSFSSDYCGGTASGGASAAGISIGLAKPLMDGNCQALRRAEKFGTAAANAYNAQMPDTASKLIYMQVYEICNAGEDSVQSGTLAQCEALGLMNVAEKPVAQPASQPPQEPTPPQDYQPRQPRGEVSPPSDDKKVAAAQTVRVRGGNGEYVEFKVGPDGKPIK